MFFRIGRPVRRLHSSRGITFHRGGVDRPVPGSSRRQRQADAETGSFHYFALRRMHEANEMIGPVIGLPTALPVIEFTNLFAEDPDGLYWKTRRVVEWAAGRPFVWVDDLITDLDVRHVAEHHAGRALLLRIDARRGLGEREFAELERWARDVSPGS
ncbi:hypothetical protein [Streptomyces turgidiscabies]